MLNASKTNPLAPPSLPPSHGATPYFLKELYNAATAASAPSMHDCMELSNYAASARHHLTLDEGATAAVIETLAGDLSPVLAAAPSLLGMTDTGVWIESTKLTPLDVKKLNWSDKAGPPPLHIGALITPWNPDLPDGKTFELRMAWAPLWAGGTAWTGAPVAWRPIPLGLVFEMKMGDDFQALWGDWANCAVAADRVALDMAQQGRLSMLPAALLKRQLSLEPTGRHDLGGNLPEPGWKGEATEDPQLAAAYVAALAEMIGPRLPFFALAALYRIAQGHLVVGGDARMGDDAVVRLAASRKGA